MPGKINDAVDGFDHVRASVLPGREPAIAASGEAATSNIAAIFAPILGAAWNGPPSQRGTS
jgi:hypothetical protein